MILLDALNAFKALLSFLFLPAVALIAGGIYYWYTGRQLAHEDKKRWGRMSLMFGIILFTIVLILSYFLQRGPLTWT